MLHLPSGPQLQSGLASLLAFAVQEQRHLPVLQGDVAVDDQQPRNASATSGSRMGPRSQRTSDTADVTAGTKLRFAWRCRTPLTNEQLQ